MQLFSNNTMEGMLKRDIGIQKAVDHADAVSLQWSQRAFNAFMDYHRENSHGHLFLTEDFRAWCKKHDKIPDPPSDRAFGAIILMARRRNLIVSFGYASVSNPNAHRTPATLWRIEK